MNKGFLLLCFALASFPAFAQQTTPAPTPQPVNEDDILILVNVTAKELKFDVVPNTNVQFPGTHNRTKIWVTDRQNLPDKVEPGVTYRNIGIQLRISSRFQDIERIVREALGEVPVSDADPTNVADAAKPPPAQPPAAKPPDKKPD